MHECRCLCQQAGHHDICQGAAERGLRSPGGHAVVADQPVCRACYEASREALLARASSGQM